MPEHARAPYEWAPDTPPHEDFLERCTREAMRLEGWAEQLEPLAATVNADGMGVVIAALKAEAAKRPVADPSGGSKWWISCVH